MAHILKWPQTSGKGVLVFTHKELIRLNLLSVGPPVNRIKRSIKISNKLELARQIADPFYFKKQLDRLKKKYIVGMHIGWYMDDVEFSGYLDFVLAPDTNLPQLDKKIPRSNLVSRRFIPDFFKPATNEEKQWDIICVSRNTHTKRLKDLLHSVRKIYDRGKKIRVLLVTPKGTNESPKTHYVEIMNDYQKLFNEDERELFSILQLSPDTLFPGISQSTIAYLYRSSKVFALFSDVEGGPKVISEALASGLRIVTYKGLRGGGNDFLDSDNSLQFDSFEDAFKTLIEAAELPPLKSQQVERNRKMVMAEHTVPQLIEFLSSVFDRLNEPFDKQLDDVEFLHQKLPAHTFRGVTWVKPRNATSDILSREEFDMFLKHALKN